jgi:hypothetical protein
VKRSWIVALAALMLVAPGCSRGPSGPPGWRILPNIGTLAWTTGEGVQSQRLIYVRRPFKGSLADLVAIETTDIPLRFAGARLVGSDAFAPCPGAAAHITFSYPPGRTIDEFAGVDRAGFSHLVSYIRPSSLASDEQAEPTIRALVCR